MLILIFLLIRIIESNGGVEHYQEGSSLSFNCNYGTPRGVGQCLAQNQMSIENITSTSYSISDVKVPPESPGQTPMPQSLWEPTVIAWIYKSKSCNDSRYRFWCRGMMGEETCLSFDKLCDSIYHCSDMSDESSCPPSTTCLLDNGGCEDLCVETNVGIYGYVKCMCQNDEHRLGKDGKSCHVVDSDLDNRTQSSDRRDFSGFEDARLTEFDIPFNIDNSLYEDALPLLFAIHYTQLNKTAVYATSHGEMLGFDYALLMGNGSNKLFLQIPKLTKLHEGIYTCIRWDQYCGLRGMMQPVVLQTKLIMVDGKDKTEKPAIWSMRNMFKSHTQNDKLVYVTSSLESILVWIFAVLFLVTALAFVVLLYRNNKSRSTLFIPRQPAPSFGNYSQIGNIGHFQPSMTRNRFGELDNSKEHKSTNDSKDGKIGDLQYYTSFPVKSDSLINEIQNKNKDKSVLINKNGMDAGAGVGKEPSVKKQLEKDDLGGRGMDSRLGLYEYHRDDNGRWRRSFLYK